MTRTAMMTYRRFTQTSSTTSAARLSGTSDGLLGSLGGKCRMVPVAASGHAPGNCGGFSYRAQSLYQVTKVFLQW